MAFLHEEGDNQSLLTLYVQPRASKNKLAGLHGNALKLYITSPPIDGQANKAVIALLAKILHLPKSSITIVAGDKSRTKQIRITGMSFSELENMLSQYL